MEEVQQGIDWKKVGVITGVLGLLFTVLVAWFGTDWVGRFLSYQEEAQPPEFRIQPDDLLERDTAAYEVTDELRWMDNPLLLGKIEVVVSATYRGDDFAGPVCIEIQPVSGPAKEVARWDDFRSDHERVHQFGLTPYELFVYSGVHSPVGAFESSNGMPESRRGEFTVQVVRQGETLSAKTVSVINTPWIHFTQLSDSTISAGETITAYVTVKNYGGPSEFNVLGLLYDATSYERSTLEKDDEGWWAGKTWGRDIYKAWQTTNREIARNETFTVTLDIPGSLFEERHLYVLETYAIKHLPYLDFPTGDWLSSEESWRARDEAHRSVIAVLAP